MFVNAASIVHVVIETMVLLQLVVWWCGGVEAAVDDNGGPFPDLASRVANFTCFISLILGLDRVLDKDSSYGA